MLPSFDPYRTGSPPLLDAAKLAEECGFDGAWVGDHLSFHPPCLEPFCALSAVSAVTSRISLGFGILLAPLRPPVWIAKQLGTLDALSSGRVILGVGVGGENPKEYLAAGVPTSERGRRLDETLEILAALMRGEALDHPGPLLPLRSPALEPVPGKMPPVVIGGRSERALRRSAEIGDGWLAVWVDTDRIKAAKVALASYSAAAGRPQPRIILMVFANIGEGSERARAEMAGLIEGQYGLTFSALERWVITGSREQAASRLKTYQDAGVDGFILVPASPEPCAQIERFAELRTLL